MRFRKPTRRSFLSALGAAGAGVACRRVERIVHPAQGGGPASMRPREGQWQLPPGATMPTRPLGRTGVRVSMLGLGGFHIGVPHDANEGVRIVRTAIDHGVTFLDNCWDYNHGESERRMGLALRDGYRQRVFLMTKLDGRTAAAARAQLEQSLERLGTDTIDLVQVHEVIRMSDAERVFAPGGAIEALVAARAAGKIRFIGFTGHKDPSIHLHMLDTAAAHGFRFDTVQMPLNVMDPHYQSFEQRVLPRLTSEGIGVIGMKALGSGILLRSGVVDPVECLHYAMNLPTSVVVTGCESVAVLEQALFAALSFRPLAAADVAALLRRTERVGRDGFYERFKTTGQFDGTTDHPEWLESDTM
jgi:predicted aldo/keto reductase-like oxidoreductase